MSCWKMDIECTNNTSRDKQCNHNLDSDALNKYEIHIRFGMFKLKKIIIFVRNWKTKAIFNKPY